MTTRETQIFEWLDYLTNDVDNTTFRMFFHTLEGYTGPTTHADMIQLINFVTAVRLHQQRESIKRVKDAMEAKRQEAKKGFWPHWGDRSDGYDGPGGAE